MQRLAFFTMGQLIEPMGHPAVQGFVDRFESVFDASDRAPGFIGRSTFDEATMRESWGDVVFPSFFPKDVDPRLLPSTLSLWEDLESVAAFAYHGPHGEALDRRRDWFVPQVEIPVYVAWWIEDGIQPTWSEAVRRVEHLHRHGPTPLAFTFRNPFDSQGNPAKLNAELVRSKVAQKVSG